MKRFHTGWILLALALAGAAAAQERPQRPEDRLADVATMLFAGQVDDARARVTEALAVYVQSGDQQHQAIAQLFLGVIDVRSERASSARLNLEQARLQFVNLGDGMGSWFAGWTLAEFERGQGRFDAAITHHEKSLQFVLDAAAPEASFDVRGLVALAPIFGFPADNLEPLIQDPQAIKPVLLRFAELFSRNGYGATLVEAGYLEAAELQLNQASVLGEAFMGLFQTPIVVAFGDLRRRQGRLEEARDSYLRALNVGGFPAIALRDEWILAQVYARLAEIDANSTRYDDALAWNDKAVQLLRNARNRQRLAEFLQERGDLLYRAGRYEDSMRVLEEALKVAIDSGDIHRQAAVLFVRVQIHMSEGRYGVAATDCEQAIALVERVDRSDLAAFLWIFRAMIHLHFEQYDGARIAIAAAEKHATKSGFRLAMEFVNLIGVLQRSLSGTGSRDELRSAFVKIADLPEAGGMLMPVAARYVVEGLMTLGSGGATKIAPPDPANVPALQGFRGLAHLLKATMELERGDTAAARVSLQNGLDYSPSRDIHALLQHLIAVSWWKDGNEEKGLQSILEAANTLDRSIEELPIDSMVAGYSGSYRRAYFEMVIERLVAQGRVAEAFDFSEKARARGFLQLLGRARFRRDNDGAAHLVREATELRAAIFRLQQELSFAPGVSGPRLETDLRQARSDYEALLLRIDTTRVNEGSSTSIETLTVEEVQAELPADTTLISYFTTARRTHAWVVDRTSVTHVALPVDEVALQRATCWAASFAHGEEAVRGVTPEDSQCEDARATPEEVFAMLFGPLKSRIRNRRLVLIPHRSLHYIPFAALRDAVTGRYLVEDYTLTYVPSASASRFLVRNETPLDGRVLVLGEPESMFGSRGALPGAATEAVRIAELFGTTAHLGAFATEDLLYDLGGGFDLVHIGAHGIYDGNNPLFSRIALAPSADHDGNLEVHEILSQLDWSGVNLVVVAACGTARGKGSGGDEVVGLTRAMLEAGTPGVMSTLWEIRDDAASALMGEFYCRLLEGDVAADALRTAQLTMLLSDEFQGPEFWAPFSLSGNPQARFGAPR